MSKILPFGFLNTPAGSLLTGADGDLVVLNGQTVIIPAGSVKDYNSIDVQSGGTLLIQGLTAGVTYIGCKSDFIVNGTVLSDGNTDQTFLGDNATLSISELDPWLGLSLNQSFTGYGLGGNGGDGAGLSSFGAGSVGTGGAGDSNGFGGGGGAGLYASWGSYVNFNHGGYGGTGGNNGGDGAYSNISGSGQSAAAGGAGGQYGNGSTAADGVANAGVGNAGFGGAGANGGAGGTRGFTSLNVAAAWMGGGGGGYRGPHGHALFILCESGVIGSGSINMSGKNGFSGGSAGISGSLAGVVTNVNYRPTSGGGGGGAGGSGGNIWIRYKTSLTVPTVISNAGSGGSGGLSTVTRDGNPRQSQYFPVGIVSGYGNGATGAAGLSSGAIDVATF